MKKGKESAEINARTNVVIVQCSVEMGFQYSA
jgi:hypothetical protein